MDKNSVLAIFAHPDDETLAAGGTLLHYAREGAKTTLICATRGEMGFISDFDIANYSNLGNVRESELREACKILGIDRLDFLDLEDGSVSAAVGMDSGNKAIAKIVSVINEIRPHTVITFGPDGLDGHDDHIAVGVLASQACVTADVDNLYYVVRPQKHDEKICSRMDVSQYVEDKLVALQCHKTQIGSSHTNFSREKLSVEHFRKAFH